MSSQSVKYRVSPVNAKNSERLKKAAEVIGNLSNSIQTEGIILSQADLSAWETLVDKYVMGLLRLKLEISTELKSHEIVEPVKETDPTKDIEGNVF
jgi:hypothetical protein